MKGKPTRFERCMIIICAVWQVPVFSNYIDADLARRAKKLENAWNEGDEGST